MRREPVELLADIGLAGDQDRLLMQPVWIEALRSLQQRRHLFGEPRLDRLRLAAGGRFRALRQKSPSRSDVVSAEIPSVSPSSN